jgi:putative ABC transport system permease protein
VNRVWTGLVGSIVEAWSELRINKTRVLLSLIGVAVAVAAITDVVALGQIAEQAQREQSERWSGRPAMLALQAYDPASGATPDPEVVDAAFDTVMERYGISYTSRNQGGSLSIQFPVGVMDSGVQAVDADYGTMHRVRLDEGRWFTDEDNKRMAPAVIVNEWFWQQLGSPPLATHPTITLPGERPTTAVIIGITASPPGDTYPQLLMLSTAWRQIMPADVAQMYGPTNYEAWVPVDLADQLMELIRRDVAGSLGAEWQVDVYRSDYLAQMGDSDPYAQIKLLIGGVAGLVLLLGALGLLNISLVTVKHRIREIGIRRSFGATAGRVFFSVMMESVVATVVAGIVGVMIAIAVVKNQLFETYVLQGIEDVPPFPVEAALVGLAAATVVGALAGILPAVIAVRVKPIDAIRY